MEHEEQQTRRCTRCLPRLKAKGVPWQVTMDWRVCCPEEVPADHEKNDGMLKTNGGSDEGKTGSSHW